MSKKQYQAAIDRMNYESDRRVRASGKHDDLHLDEDSMTALVEIGGEKKGPVNFEYETCPTCRGTGTHVDPSVDAGGLSREDFARDPEFAERYAKGSYDQPCNECDGKRVVPRLRPDGEEQEAIVERYHQMEQAESSTREMQRAERMMGA